METIVEQERAPDVSAEQQALDDLVKRIQKLRWIGMKADAEERHWYEWRCGDSS